MTLGKCLRLLFVICIFSFFITFGIYPSFVTIVVLFVISYNRNYGYFIIIFLLISSLRFPASVAFQLLTLLFGAEQKVKRVLFSNISTKEELSFSVLGFSFHFFFETSNRFILDSLAYV